jgi:CubicO group peptidase (beta-lactamase class C family)
MLLNAVLASSMSAQGFQAEADQLVSSYASPGEFRGAVMVARNGQVLFQRSYGNAVEAWGISNTPNTKFELASLTKQFTGAAILMPAEAERLNLDDKVAKFFPQAPESWKGITIKQLVTHTSGLPNNEIRDFNKGLCVPYTEDELLGTFKNRPLKFEPGTDWAYTNTEYYLLAYVIGSVSGKTYADFLTQNVFQPLGMSNSGFASTLTIVSQMAEGYTREGKSR